MLTNSEVCANIPIPIARIIISIESKRSCISAIIRIVADMKDAPTFTFLTINPLFIVFACLTNAPFKFSCFVKLLHLTNMCLSLCFLYLKSEARANIPKPKGRITTSSESKRPRIRATIRNAADTMDAPTATSAIKVCCAMRPR